MDTLRSSLSILHCAVSQPFVVSLRELCIRCTHASVDIVWRSIPVCTIDTLRTHTNTHGHNTTHCLHIQSHTDTIRHTAYAFKHTRAQHDLLLTHTNTRGHNTTQCLHIQTHTDTTRHTAYTYKHTQTQHDLLLTHI